MSIIIEGHTDKDPTNGEKWFKDNWDLSAARASSTYRLIVQRQPQLLDLVNEPPAIATGERLFAVAGFSDQRPIVEERTDADKTRNRREDIRLLMAPPSLERLTDRPDPDQ